MAARPTWKGFLKVSLVTIPVRVYPATESAATISFNQLHDECQTRIQQKKWCPSCEREVTSAEIVKGYEFEKGRWVVVGDEDIAKVKTESTKIINLAQFAADDEIDPMYVDKTYYLAPEGPMASDAYAVMRDGMKGKVGIGKVAIHGREYLVAVRPHKQGLVMHTLHHAAEMRTIDQIDELREVRGSVSSAEAKLAQQVIASYEAPLDLATYSDECRCVADDSAAQRRSASRAARMDSASTHAPVAAIRARARAMTSSTGGRAAVSISIPRTYSWRDLPARAARAASSSRTSSGTFRTVIATLMQALWQQ